MRVTLHSRRGRQVVPVWIIAVLLDDLYRVSGMALLLQTFAFQRGSRAGGHDGFLLASQVAVESSVHLEGEPAVEETARLRKDSPQLRLLHDDVVIILVGNDN